MATLTLPCSRLRLAVLAALIAWAPVSGAAPQGTPITIDGPPAVPAADLQGTIAHLEGFLDQTDQYIRAVQVTSESYRQYLEQHKALWASCQVKADLGGYETSPFSGLAQAGDAECSHYANLMEQKAQEMAAQLDVAVKFQKEVRLFASEVVIPRIERLRIVQRMQHLDEQVQRGLSDIQNAREGYKPWLD